MILTDIVEVIHLQASRLTLYHEKCYLPLAKPTDIVIRLIGVPAIWVDPGCARCHCALAASPVDEQMERDFLRSIDELEGEYLKGESENVA